MTSAPSGKGVNNSPGAGARQEEMLAGNGTFLGSLPVFTFVPPFSRKESWCCAGGEVGCGDAFVGNRAKSSGGNRKVQEWYHIKQDVQQAVVHGPCMSTVSVLSVPSLQNSGGIVTWER